MGAQVIVTKLMSPIVQLRFSKQICVIARDGNLYLSFRLGHPQGHCITNLTVEATWTHSETTAEGEKFVQIDLVEFPMQGSVLFLPRTFTHKIDPTSPFWPYREALCEAHGGSAAPWPGQGTLAAAVLPSEVAAAAVVTRATLTKCALAVWASGSTVEAAAAA